MSAFRHRWRGDMSLQCLIRASANLVVVGRRGRAGLSAVWDGPIWTPRAAPAERNVHSSPCSWRLGAQSRRAASASLLDRYAIASSTTACDPASFERRSIFFYANACGDTVRGESLGATPVSGVRTFDRLSKARHVPLPLHSRTWDSGDFVISSRVYLGGRRAAIHTTPPTQSEQADFRQTPAPSGTQPPDYGKPSGGHLSQSYRAALISSATEMSSRIYTQLQHPPTMQELLKAAQGFWPRFKLRVRMVLLGRTWRAWRADDVLALVSLVVFSHFFFILLATTTFFSLVLFIINSLPFQDFLSRLVARYISDITWSEMTFESGIVPKWREGVIRLNNVTVKRTFESEKRHWDRWKKSQYEKGQGPDPARSPPTGDGVIPGQEFDEDTGLTRAEKNFMVFEVVIGEIDLTLSLWRALEGKGLVKDCTIKNVRGVVDRRHVDFSGLAWSAETSRANNIPGYFEMDHFEAQDVVLSVYQPQFRPFTVSLFSMDMPRLRWEWFLYDLLNADSMVGMFDNSLFSVHKRKIGGPGLEFSRNVAGSSRGVTESWTVEDEILLERSEPGTVLIHARVDNVPIDHLNNNTQGPFGWITSGTIDLDCKILLPSSGPVHTILGVVASEAKDLIGRIQESAERSPATAGSTISESAIRDFRSTIDGELPVPVSGAPSGTMQKQTLASRITASVDDMFMDNPLWRKMHHQSRAKDRKTLPDAVSRPLPSSRDAPAAEAESDSADRPAKFFWHVKMNNLKAAVPLATPEIGYVTGTLVRPVVAYMNANRTLLPMRFSFAVPMNHLHGAWTVYDAHLYDKFSDGLGKSIVDLMQDERERAKRIRRVGIWSLRSVARNVREIYDSFRGAKWIPLGPERSQSMSAEPVPF